MTTLFEAVQHCCLAMPETEQKTSHGFPVFMVRGKQFATYSLNHHGDGKVALLLNTSPETQTMLIDSAPSIFYKPPYVGPKGWIGVELNQGLKWSRVQQLTFEAYLRTAPTSLAKQATQPDTAPPTQELKPEDVDPLRSRVNLKLLAQIESICLALPETTLGAQFGNPAFLAGKKTFCLVAHSNNGAYLQVWVGRDAQSGYTDQKYTVPPYVGHNGWLNVALAEPIDWPQIAQMIDKSYRHFALKRMLKMLDT